MTPATEWGNQKAAATRLGITHDEYARHLEAGEKWCAGCKAWHSRDAFGTDTSRSDGLQRYCRRGRKAWAQRKKAAQE